MAGSLSLLFELDTNPAKAVAGFKRAHVEFAREIEAMRKLAAQAFTLPPIKLPTAPTSRDAASGRSKAPAITDSEKRARDSQREFEKRVAAESRANAAAAEALQRQRSAALIGQLRAQEKAAERTAKVFRDRFLTIGGVFEQVGQSISSFGQRLSVAVTAPLAALAAISVKSAISLDAQVNTLKAFTGGAEAAEQRLSKLIATAQKTPGLTTSLSLMLDSQLRLAEVTVETIDKVTPAIGRLNAVQKLQDPGRFSQNLVQLVTQNFERMDLKELVGQSPVAGQIIKELFNVDSPTNAAAIRESAQRLGLTTTNAFFAAFAEAAERNPALANVTESLATRFEKLSDRISIAFRPLGLAIIDAITPIATALVPIIEAIGKGFASLPGPIKFVVVALGGLAAATGPAVFLLGQMISAAGSLIGAYARLVSIGLTPTIQGFQLLTQVMRGNAALTAGQAATTAVAAGGWIALAGAIVGVVAILAVVGFALAGYIRSQKESTKISAEQIAATKAQIASLQTQVKFIDSLKGGVERTATEQKRLADIYGSLNVQAKIRVSGITDEEKRLAALRAEIERILQLRREEQAQQGANLAANLASTVAQIQANERARDNIVTQIEVNTRLAESLRSTGKINADQARLLAAQLGPLGQNIGDVDTATRALNLQNEKLINQQDKLIKSSAELRVKAEDEGAALAALEKNSAGSARQFLALAKQIGLFTGNVEDSLAAMDRFIAKQDQATRVTDGFTESLRQQNEELLRAGKEADDAAKERNDKIKAASSLAREASDDLGGALKLLKAFIAAQPDLRAAFTKEAQLAGKSFSEFVEEAVGGQSKGRAGTSLRNAQEQFAKAVEAVAEASAVRLRSIERDKNDDLLQQNENAFHLQLIAFEQYIRDREFLARQNIEIEIREQEALHTRALAEQERFLARSRKAGVPTAERTKAVAEATQAEQKAIEAATRINNLRAEQKRLTVDANQAIAEAAKQQIEDVRRLDIEFAELRGSIEDALNTQTIEKFRGRLLALALAQDNIRKQLELAHALGPEETERLKAQQRLNQSEIDLIELLKEQEFATNKLAAANEFVRRVKEKQEELERDLSFQVEFRGLKEEEAIKKRLEGERELANSLRIVRDLVQAEVDALSGKGVKPPQALLDFIRDTNNAIKGLGKLPFTEQFRLAQKEFDRVNNLRLQKIEEVERAVRNRDIAEVEGAIAIREINGEYIDALEKRLALLKQIAAQSKDTALKQQALSARKTIDDTKDENAELTRQIELNDPTSGRSVLGDVFADTVNNTGSVLQGLLATAQDVFSQLSAQAGNMRDILVNVFSSIGQAVGDAVQAFVLYGGAGTSFKKVSAQIIASVASMAAVKAIFELAEGFAALARGIFGNPKGFAEAALHFKSAAIYGAVAGAAALAGRAVAGNSFNDNKGTASAAVNGGEPAPRNRDFQNTGQTVESSSQAAREGSGGFFGQVVDQIRAVQQQGLDMQRQLMLLQGQTAQALTRIQSMPHGQALAIGAEENPAAVGRAVINHSNSDGDFNESLQRNLGFAR